MGHPNPLNPGLRLATRSLYGRITELEQAVIDAREADDQRQALHAAYTAGYLRAFLAELIGPTWMQWTVPDWPAPKSTAVARKEAA
ncbi:hypothetical protein ACFXKJ_02865 [Kitasatospora indigofera]|uniref:hypothetical protein n=1 Tax=Kitasatospora indigofera TaxID=67307 RepID=UPI0036CD52FC